jgi:hypothetical protein
MFFIVFANKRQSGLGDGWTDLVKYKYTLQRFLLAKPLCSRRQHRSTLLLIVAISCMLLWMTMLHLPRCHSCTMVPSYSGSTAVKKSSSDTAFLHGFCSWLFSNLTAGSKVTVSESLTSVISLMFCSIYFIALVALVRGHHELWVETETGKNRLLFRIGLETLDCMYL